MNNLSSSVNRWVNPSCRLGVRRMPNPVGKLKRSVSRLPVVRGGPPAADYICQSATVVSGAGERIGPRPMLNE